jgi:hypothetical protein
MLLSNPRSPVRGHKSTQSVANYLTSLFADLLDERCPYTRTRLLCILMSPIRNIGNVRG